MRSRQKKPRALVEGPIDMLKMPCVSRARSRNLRRNLTSYRKSVQTSTPPWIKRVHPHPVMARIARQTRRIQRLSRIFATRLNYLLSRVKNGRSLPRAKSSVLMPQKRRSRRRSVSLSRYSATAKHGSKRRSQPLIPPLRSKSRWRISVAPPWTMRRLSETFPSNWHRLD